MMANLLVVIGATGKQASPGRLLLHALSAMAVGLVGGFGRPTIQPVLSYMWSHEGYQ